MSRARFLIAGKMPAVLAPALGLLCGCLGYRLGPVAPTGYKTVAVPMFRNATLRPQLEAQVTNAVLKRLQTDGSLRVASAAEAELLLSGTIVGYERTPLRSLREDTGVPREYRITITAEVQARERHTGRVLLEPTRVSGHCDAFIGDDQQSAELQALPLVAEDLARRVVSLLVERW